MFDGKLIDIMEEPPRPDTLWAGEHKIPWHDPEFSSRMLLEHLSQDHQLASRRADIIAAQARWIASTLPGGGERRVLDLGCGPGLYAPHLLEAGHRYRGIDFGPASIDHARRSFAVDPRCEFTLGDIRTADYGQEQDMVMMLYGELNVFSPENCAQMLARALGALRPGGRLLLEVHTREAVEQTGQGSSWYKADRGLFSDEPHLCLMESRWYEEPAVSLQLFHVVDLRSGGLRSFRSTMQAYGLDDYRRLLRSAGFGELRCHEDWPGCSEELMVISARRE